jgi:peptidoglycan hydrolase CwlO-like protein
MAERIEKIVAYDQRLLEEFKENKILIQAHENRLRTDKTELEELRAKAEEEKEKVSGMVKQTAGAIAKYGDQISSAEKKALDYEAQIRKKEKYGKSEGG